MKLITPLFIIGICVGVYFVYINPTLSSVSALTAQKDSYNQVLQQAKEVASKRDQALADYNAISQDDLSRLDKIVPVSFNSVAFANYLSGIAGKYGLVVAKMQITEQNLNDGQVVVLSTNSYQKKNVNFSITGQYTSLENFLKDLESGLTLVDVTGLSVKKNSTDKSNSSFEFNINLNTYSLN
jgi:Tfp pilus assembly protein PilO